MVYTIKFSRSVLAILTISHLLYNSYNLIVIKITIKLSTNYIKTWHIYKSTLLHCCYRALCFFYTNRQYEVQEDHLDSDQLIMSIWIVTLLQLLMQDSIVLLKYLNR